MTRTIRKIAAGRKNDRNLACDRPQRPIETRSPRRGTRREKTRLPEFSWLRLRSRLDVRQNGLPVGRSGPKALKLAPEMTLERIADRVVQVRQDGLALHERRDLGVEGRIRGRRDPCGRGDVSADAYLDRLGLFR